MEKWFVNTEAFEEATRLHNEVVELCDLMQCYAIMVDCYGRASELSVKAKAHELRADELKNGIGDMKFDELIMLHTELTALYSEASTYASKLGFHESAFEFGMVRSEAHHMEVWQLENQKNNK